MIAQNPGPPNDVLTLAEAARFLRISERSCWELARRGELPHRRIGTLYRFSKDQLKQFVQQTGKES
jgi:PTS system nitrogen regulatory IIA component